MRKAAWLLSALATMAILTLAACSSNEGKPGGEDIAAPTDAGPATFTGDLLATSNRDHMAFCASGAGGYEVSEADSDRISKTIDSVIERVGSENWPQGRTLFSLTTVDCPEPAVPLGRGFLEEKGTADFAVATDNPIFYRVLIYLVGNDVYESTFGWLVYARAPAELLCTGDQCAEVTTALYVPASISDADLEEGLFQAVGILAPGG